MNPMIKTSHILGSLAAILLFLVVLNGCESYVGKDEVVVEEHPLTQFTRELVTGGVEDARQGIDPRNRIVDRFGLTGDEAQHVYNALDPRRAHKSDATLEDFLDLHEDLEPAERRQIEEVFAIALSSTSPEDLDVRLIDYRESLGIAPSEESIVGAYVAILRGLAFGYQDLQQKAIAQAIHESQSVIGGNGFFRLAQYQGGDDGRFDYPPRLIESWTEFAQGMTMAGLTGGALGAGTGAIACTPSVLLTAAFGPVLCAVGFAAAGFVVGAGMYAVVTFVTAEIEYDGEIILWCKRQAGYVVQHEDYGDLCDEDGRPKRD
jgi:hypothetical protein